MEEPAKRGDCCFLRRCENKACDGSFYSRPGANPLGTAPTFLGKNYSELVWDQFCSGDKRVCVIRLTLGRVTDRLLPLYLVAR